MKRAQNCVYITDNFIRFGPGGAGREINTGSLKNDEAAAALKGLLKKSRIAREHLILGIPRTRAAVRYLTLPAHNEEEINRMAEYELYTLFPCKPQDLIFSYAAIDKRPDGYSQVMLVAAPKEDVFDRISTLSAAGITPEAITISSAALYNQFHKQKRQPGDYLLANLDDGFMDLLLISGRKPVFSRGVRIENPPEIKDLVKSLEENAAILKNNGNSINSIILSGNGCDKGALAQGLKNALPYSVEIDNSLSVLNGLEQGIDNSALKINLLPEELKARKIKDKRRRSVFLFFALLLLNLSLCANIIYQRIRARQEYLSAIKSGIRQIIPRASLLENKKLKTQIIKMGINSGRLTLGLLTALYRAAPEDMSFNTLVISRRKAPASMVVTGQAADSEGVLKFANALKESDLIKSADVANIAQLKPPQEKGVSFELRAAVDKTD